MIACTPSPCGDPVSERVSFERFDGFSRVAQTRFRFLRAAWEASGHSPSGAAMRAPRSHTAVVNEQVVLAAAATVPPSQ